MATKRTLTNILFLSSLALGAATAAFSPDEAQAGDKKHKSDDTYECSTTPNAGKLGGSAAKFKKLCGDAGVKNYGDMKKLMKKWLKAKGKDPVLKAGDETLKVEKCATCHEDANGMEGTKPEAYKFLDALMP